MIKFNDFGILAGAAGHARGGKATGKSRSKKRK